MAAGLFAMFPWIIIALLLGYGFGYRDGKKARR